MPISVNVTLTNPAQTVSYILPSGAPASSLRELVVGVYAPSQPGTYPVIVYSHGHGGSSSSTQGAGLTAQALADLGYIVLMPNHLDSIALYPDWIRSQFTVFNTASGLQRAADMQFVLTQASNLAARLPPGYGVDLTAPVAAGHSNGAFTTAVLGGLTTGAATYDLQPGNPYGLTSVTDARFAALILISPQGQDTSWTRLGQTAWDNISVPTLIITGDEDNEPLGGPGRWQGRLDAFRYSDQGSTLALVYRGAGHDDVGGNTDIAGLTAAIALGIDRFLDAWLRGDPAALAIVSDPTLLSSLDPLLFEAFARNLAGEPGQGVINGTDAADVLSGLNSNDQLIGGSGDDTLRGDRGNDRIEGGDGWDTALVSGSRTDYRILITNDGFLIKGPDGLDYLTSVEILRFDEGGVFDLARLYGSGWLSLDQVAPEILPGVADDLKGDSDGREVLPGPSTDSPDLLHPGLARKLAMLFVEAGEQAPGHDLQAFPSPAHGDDGWVL